MLNMTENKYVMFRFHRFGMRVVPASWVKFSPQQGLACYYPGKDVSKSKLKHLIDTKANFSLDWPFYSGSISRRSAADSQLYETVRESSEEIGNS